MSKKYYVYRHLKADTGEVFYVGKGCGKRMHAIYNRSKYWLAIREKHGVVSELIKDGLDEKEAYDLECFWIKKYKELGQCVANFTLGGDGVRVKKRWWGDKISKTLTGISRSKGSQSKLHKEFASIETLAEEYKAMGIIKIAEKYGVSPSLVWQRLKTAGVKMRKFSQIPRSVMCVDDGMVYPSIKEAAAAYSCHATNIVKAINGTYKTTANRKFCYA